MQPLQTDQIEAREEVTRHTYYTYRGGIPALVASYGYRMLVQCRCWDDCWLFLLYDRDDGSFGFVTADDTAGAMIGRWDCGDDPDRFDRLRERWYAESYWTANSYLEGDLIEAAEALFNGCLPGYQWLRAARSGYVDCFQEASLQHIARVLEELA